MTHERAFPNHRPGDTGKISARSLGWRFNCSLPLKVSICLDLRYIAQYILFGGSFKSLSMDLSHTIMQVQKFNGRLKGFVCNDKLKCYAKARGIGDLKNISSHKNFLPVFTQVPVNLKTQCKNSGFYYTRCFSTSWWAGRFLVKLYQYSLWSSIMKKNPFLLIYCPLG